MNNDELFRQALQRQNDRAARMKMPHDMEQRVKNRIKSENIARHWLRPAAIVVAAASILLLLTLHFTNKDIEPKEHPMTAQQTERQANKTDIVEKPAIGQKPVAVQRIQVMHRADIKRPTIAKTKPAPVASSADQLNNYIARLEAEMEAVDDSVRSAHLEKLIAADMRLQQLVNRIVKDETEQAMRELQKDSTANYITF